MYIIPGEYFDFEPGTIYGHISRADIVRALDIKEYRKGRVALFSPRG